MAESLESLEAMTAEREQASRTLLLCFIHGFKGNDNTFQRFPEDLEAQVTKRLPGHRVRSVVYPKYETKGELAQCTEQFLAWLKERVMDLRKTHSDKPWPPHDRDVGVILIAHSMGGFVASDTLFLALNERHNAQNSKDGEGGGAAEGSSSADNASKKVTPPPLFPLIQGIVAFDTPYNGLARSMFVYGAFSNYNKVSSVFNVMTALAAAPAGLSKLAVRRAAKVGVTKSAASRAASASAAAAGAAASNPGWKAWQLLAVRTGTVGAIAAGGVAAYVHRRQIMAGIRSVRELDRASIAEGYQRSVGALGQGLAYVNRGNVGKSYAWLADHFTFVGALVKPRELERRLGRLAALRGVGFRDFYASLGENGYWSGGYFVPERTFCAVPGNDEDKKSSGEEDKDKSPAASALFERRVISEAADEVEAHMSLFKPDKNSDYTEMTARTAALVAEWFVSEADVEDDPKFAPGGAEDAGDDAMDVDDAKAEEKIIATDGGVEIAGGASPAGTESEQPTPASGGDSGEEQPTQSEVPQSGADAVVGHKPELSLPDESPVDIAAAASLEPLPDDDDLELTAAAGEEGAATEEAPTEQEKRTYLRHLFDIAEQAGTGLRSATTTWSSRMEQIPKPSMPNMPAMTMPSMPAMPAMPTFSMFSKKKQAQAEPEPQPEAQPEQQHAEQQQADASAAAPATASSVGQQTEPAVQGETQDEQNEGETVTWASAGQPPVASTAEKKSTTT